MAVVVSMTSSRQRRRLLAQLTLICLSNVMAVSGWVTKMPNLRKNTAVRASAPIASTTAATTGGAISLSIEELAARLGGMGRAKLVWDCYRGGIDPSLYFRQTQSDPDIEALLPGSRRHQRLGSSALELLDKLYNPSGSSLEGGVARLGTVVTSADGTTKFLLHLAKDGAEVETVIIPWEGGTRSTLCISSQVGCRQGCTFCATGKMGKVRSLSSDEILVQMFFARKLCRERNLPVVSNVVFMGMGEPADNADAVITATVQLTTRHFFQLAARKVTVSTVAPTPAAFTKFATAPCVLAWSVHAADDTLRHRLVPTTRYTMKELRQGLIQALQSRNPGHMQTTMIEVALMQGVNDRLPNDADALAALVHGITAAVPTAKVMVNLIPYNPGTIVPTTFQRPSFLSVRAFQKRLWEQGVYTHVRTTRGDDESAACGQLATKSSRQKQRTAAAAQP